MVGKRDNVRSRWPIGILYKYVEFGRKKNSSLVIVYVTSIFSKNTMVKLQITYLAPHYLVKRIILQCCKWCRIVCNFLFWWSVTMRTKGNPFGWAFNIHWHVTSFSTVMNIYCCCKCVKPRMIYQALTPHEYREVCCASMQPQNIFTGIEIPRTLPGIRKTSVAS